MNGSVRSLNLNGFHTLPMLNARPLGRRWCCCSGATSRPESRGFTELPCVPSHNVSQTTSFGVTLEELYKIFFGTNYFDDLRVNGFPRVADLLKDIHERRNAFAHGRPRAINDLTVNALVENLKAEHDAWIAVYNSRVIS
ncbi:hypothetical protein RFM52_17720 [Mesorhizobium sp. VK2B]|uniref:RiboL-PSP-HEPN domain-containing protein n=1 Tax=Mesorhizobium humile TaxID=3072313 RepID=A0ABU4YJB4_9HYPH|nr:hypothetical protein [Mesorhizobium sp. VK2B]